MSIATWAAATRAGALHDRIVLTCPAGADVAAAGLQRALEGRPGTSGGPVRVLGVDEPPDARLGNLGGAVAAWRAARAAWPRLVEALADGGSLLMLHDAGAASRSWPWAAALDGRRGDLPLPGGGVGQNLREVAARQLAPLAASGRGGFVDVAWTSQLFLPDLAPEAVPRPRADLTKLVAPWDGVAEPALELGWFRRADRLGFAPGSSQPDRRAWEAWRAGAPAAADLGTFRASTRLLDALATLDLQHPVDLDPGLTAGLLGARTPVVDALAGAGVHPTVDLLPCGAVRWWRLRRASEVAALLADVLVDPDLRALLDLHQPVHRSTLGGVSGEALSWEEVTRGAQLGGVSLRGAVVWDAALATGSQLDASVIVGATGHVEATGSALIGGEDLRAQLHGAWSLRTSGPVRADAEVVAAGVRAPLRAPLRRPGEAG